MIVVPCIYMLNMHGIISIKLHPYHVHNGYKHSHYKIYSMVYIKQLLIVKLALIESHQPKIQGPNYTSRSFIFTNPNLLWCSVTFLFVPTLSKHMQILFLKDLLSEFYKNKKLTISFGVNNKTNDQVEKDYSTSSTRTQVDQGVAIYCGFHHQFIYNNLGELWCSYLLWLPS